MVAPVAGGGDISGTTVCGTLNNPVPSGGGGGAVGRVRIATSTGMFTSNDDPLVDAVVTTDTLIFE